MLRTALALAQKGFAVFPCRARDKQPATQHGFKDATSDPQVIMQWWQQEPHFNLAIATGAVSGVFVIDIDGMDAELEMRRLEAEHGALPASVEVITARGRHIYFRCPEIPIRNSAGKIAVHVDVRGDGGYVVTPPSIHPSGRPYTWSVDSHSALAAAPDWLLARIGASPSTSPVTTPSSEWSELIAGAVPEGRRDCTLTKVAGHLMRRYVDPFVVAGLLRDFNIMHCAPPLPDKDIARILNSIAGKEIQRRCGSG